MKKERVLIIGGMHGDEPTGVAVARYLQLHPIVGIDAIVANTDAVADNIRFVETDLNRSFAPKLVVSAEEIIAQKLKHKLQHYDLIIDIHNTRGDFTTCAITTCKPNALHFSLAKYFGFDRLVVMPPSGSLIAEAKERAISLEIALNERQGFSVEKLIQRIQALDIASAEQQRVIVYQYVQALKTATLQRVGINPQNIQNFKDLSFEQKENLGLPRQKVYCPIFAKKRFEGENGFDLVEKL